MNKKSVTSLAIIVGCLAIVGFTTSFAYFSAQFDELNNNNSSLTSSKVGNILYEGETTFTGTDVYPGLKAVQTFTISKGQDAGTGIYEIDLASTLPSAFGSDVQISLYKTTDPETNNISRSEGTLTQTAEGFQKEDSITINGTPELVYGPTVLTNSSKIVLEQIEFNTETLAETTYYLVYEYANNGNQNAQQGETFSGKVTVTLAARGSL